MKIKCSICNETFEGLNIPLHYPTIINIKHLYRFCKGSGKTPSTKLKAKNE